MLTVGPRESRWLRALRLLSTALALSSASTSASGAGELRYGRPLTGAAPDVGRSRPRIIRIVVDFRPVGTEEGGDDTGPDGGADAIDGELAAWRCAPQWWLHRSRRARSHGVDEEQEIELPRGLELSKQDSPDPNFAVVDLGGDVLRPIVLDLDELPPAWVQPEVVEQPKLLADLRQRSRLDVVVALNDDERLHPPGRAPSPR
jgi:hypothetical protein